MASTTTSVTKHHETRICGISPLQVKVLYAHFANLGATNPDMHTQGCFQQNFAAIPDLAYRRLDSPRRHSDGIYFFTPLPLDTYLATLSDAKREGHAMISSLPPATTSCTQLAHAVIRSILPGYHRTFWDIQESASLTEAVGRSRQTDPACTDRDQPWSN